MSKITRGPVEKELIRQIHKNAYNFLRRIARVQAKFGTTQAIIKWQKSKYYKDNPTFKIKGLGRKELQDMLHEIKQLNAMKTSTIKGVKRFRKMQEDLNRIYNTLGSEYGKKIDVLYSKLVEENRFWEKYKYEIRDAIEYCYNQGMSDDEILEFLKERLDELYEEVEDRPIKMEDIIRM